MFTHSDPCLAPTPPHTHTPPYTDTQQSMCSIQSGPAFNIYNSVLRISCPWEDESFMALWLPGSGGCNLSQHYPPVAQGHIKALKYLRLILEYQIHEQGNDSGFRYCLDFMLTVASNVILSACTCINLGWPHRSRTCWGKLRSQVGCLLK